MSKIKDITVGSYVTWAASDEYYNDFGQRIEAIHDDDYIADKKDLRYLYMGRVIDIGEKYIFVINDRINESPKRYIVLSQKDLDNINFQITEHAKKHTYPDIGGSSIRMLYDFNKNPDDSLSPKAKFESYFDNEYDVYNFIEKGMRFIWYCKINNDMKENEIVPFHKMR